MQRLWKWIRRRKISSENRIKLFLFLNSLLCGVIGFAVWVFVGRYAFSTWDWALCFIGYPGFFGGFIGGFMYLCRLI